MLNRAAHTPEELKVDPMHPFVIFSEKRGLLSRHRTVTGATLAFCAQMQTSSALGDPPRLYEYTLSGWRRV